MCYYSIPAIAFSCLNWNFAYSGIELRFLPISLHTLCQCLQWTMPISLNSYKHTISLENTELVWCVQSSTLAVQKTYVYWTLAKILTMWPNFWQFLRLGSLESRGRCAVPPTPNTPEPIPSHPERYSLDQFPQHSILNPNEFYSLVPVYSRPNISNAIASILALFKTKKPPVLGGHSLE